MNGILCQADSIRVQRARFAYALLPATVVALLICSGCNQPKKTAGSPAPEPIDRPAPHYVWRAGYDTVVVFVHGIFGNGRTTWLNTTTNAYWPDLLRTDDAFKESDIYVHSFSSPYFSNSYTIDDLVENMREVFDKDGVMDHKEVVFICHSMGGLVVRGFLKRYQQYAQKVSLIYFYSTPTDGAHITQLARFLSQNPQLRGMLPIDSNDYLNGIQKDWRAIPARIYSRCGYEKLNTYGIRIVDEKSATTLCDGPVDPLYYDHIDIVKPAGTNDLRYSCFRVAFKTRPGAPQTTVILKSQIQVRVPCGHAIEQTTEIKLPQALTREQRVADAIVALESGRNLKEQSAYKVDVTQSLVLVHYKLIGLDRDAAGACGDDGSAVITANFLVNQPAVHESRTASVFGFDSGPGNLFTWPIFGRKTTVSATH